MKIKLFVAMFVAAVVCAFAIEGSAGFWGGNDPDKSDEEVGSIQVRQIQGGEVQRPSGGTKKKRMALEQEKETGQEAELEEEVLLNQGVVQKVVVSPAGCRVEIMFGSDGRTVYVDENEQIEGLCTPYLLAKLFGAYVNIAGLGNNQGGVFNVTVTIQEMIPRTDSRDIRARVMRPGMGSPEQ